MGLMFPARGWQDCGGIRPESAMKLKELNHPRFVGVDINSGFETTPGLKDVAKIQQFKHDLFS